MSNLRCWFSIYFFPIRQKTHPKGQACRSEIIWGGSSKTKRVQESVPFQLVMATLDTSFLCQVIHLTLYIVKKHLTKEDLSFVHLLPLAFTFFLLLLLRAGSIIIEVTCWFFFLFSSSASCYSWKKRREKGTRGIYFVSFVYDDD
jgi:hypothetical protein